MKNVLKNCLVLMCLGFFVACGSDSDGPDGSGGCDEERINNRSMEFINAGTVYVQDPTEANCEAYKVAIQAYLDAIDACDNLYETELDEAKEAAEQLECE